MLRKMSADVNKPKTHQPHGGGRRLPLEGYQTPQVCITPKLLATPNSALVSSKYGGKATAPSRHSVDFHKQSGSSSHPHFCSSENQSTCISKDVSFLGHTPCVLEDVKTLTAGTDFSAVTSGLLWGCNADHSQAVRKKSHSHEKNPESSLDLSCCLEFKINKKASIFHGFLNLILRTVFNIESWKPGRL